MNQLLQRLYTSRSNSKKKRLTHVSADKALVPKMQSKALLESLVEAPYDKHDKKGKTNKSNIGKLPSITLAVGEPSKTRSNFRNRKLSTHLHNFESTILFPTEILEATPTSSELPIQVEPPIKTYIHPETSPLGELYPPESNENELFQYLTVLESNIELKEEFCYMNRNTLPYSFSIVEYTDRNCYEYLTVSLRGITYYKENESEFYTVRRMVKEIEVYRRVKRIEYFDRYLAVKVMRHWKARVMRRQFIGKCRFVSGNFFLQNGMMQGYLVYLHGLVEGGGGSGRKGRSRGGGRKSFLGFDVRQTVQLEELKMIGKEVRERFIGNEIVMEGEIENRLKEVTKECLNKFRIAQRLTLPISTNISTAANTGINTGTTPLNPIPTPTLLELLPRRPPSSEERESYLPYDSKRRSMRYTQLAKLKEHEGMLYRLIKYTDQVRHTIKLNTVRTLYVNTLAELVNLQELFLGKDKVPIISWVSIDCTIEKKRVVKSSMGVGLVRTTISEESLSMSPSSRSVSYIKCEPSIEEVYKSILEQKEEILTEYFKHHNLLIEHKDKFYCENYELEEEEIVSKLEFKYAIIKDKEFENMNKEFEDRLQWFFKQVEEYIEKINNSMLGLYDECRIGKTIDVYLENEELKRYLERYEYDRIKIDSWEEIGEFAIVVLKMGAIKAEVKRRFEEKYKMVIKAVPNEILRRCEILNQDIRNLYNNFKENPHNIQEFIELYGLYTKGKSELMIIERRIELLVELEEMIDKNGIKIGEGRKLLIGECKVLYKELERRFVEIEENEGRDRRRFEIGVEGMLPMLEEAAEELLKELRCCESVNSPIMELEVVEERLNEFVERFKKLEMKKEEVYKYEDALGLGHKEIQSYGELESSLEWLKRIWRGRKECLGLFRMMKELGYGQIAKVDLGCLNLAMKELEIATVSKEVECAELLKEFKYQYMRLSRLIRGCTLLASETLQPEHIAQIRTILHFESITTKSATTKVRTSPTLSSIVPGPHDIIFTREGSRTITGSYLETQSNLLNIIEPLTQIVWESTRDGTIKKQLIEIEEYWRRGRVKFIQKELNTMTSTSTITTITSTSTTPSTTVQHLDDNEELHEKLGVFIITLKSIDKETKGNSAIKEKLINNMKICEYVREVLEKWKEVEKLWLKLLPIMINCPSVKHQSNVYFEFTGVDGNMKKLIKQVAEVHSLRKLVDDISDKQIMEKLTHCEEELKVVENTLEQYLEGKRMVYPRFYFVTDDELIGVLEHVKDARTLSSYVELCFGCMGVVLEGELIAGFVGIMEIYRMRRSILRGEADEIFRQTEENMRMTMRSMMRGLVGKHRQGICEGEITEYPLQVWLVVDRIIWSELLEHYLGTRSYNDLNMELKGIEETLRRSLLKQLSREDMLKVSYRLSESIWLRERGEDMIKEEVGVDDFKWKKELKYGLWDEEVGMEMLGRRMWYGLEYCGGGMRMSGIYNEQMIGWCYEGWNRGNVLELVGVKKEIMKDIVGQFGCYYRELVCNRRMVGKDVMRFVRGGLAVGGWVGFYDVKVLDCKVREELLESVIKGKELEGLVKGKECRDGKEGKGVKNTLFAIVSHREEECEKSEEMTMRTLDSVYCADQHVYRTINGFHSYYVYEPEYRKLCESLLQLYIFKYCSELAAKTISYMEHCRPFFERILGSQMSLLKRVIDEAGNRKLNIIVGTTTTMISGTVTGVGVGYNVTIESESVLIVEAIRKEVIMKQREEVVPMLVRALEVYFPGVVAEGKESKMSVVEELVTLPSENINLSLHNSELYNEKESILTELLLTLNSTTILLGPHSCKTTLLTSTLTTLSLPSFFLYSQCTNNLFSSNMVESLEQLSEEHVLVYDANIIVEEWRDMIMGGMVVVNGRKVKRGKRRMVMEVRSLEGVGVGFVGCCQIVYAGEEVVGKWEKFWKGVKIGELEIKLGQGETKVNEGSTTTTLALRTIDTDKSKDNCQPTRHPTPTYLEILSDVMIDLFGTNLEKLPITTIEPLTALLSNPQSLPTYKTLHRYLTWTISLLTSSSTLWQQYYPGRYIDYTIQGNTFELISVDIVNSYQLSCIIDGKYMIVPTRMTTFFTSIIMGLVKDNLLPCLIGGVNCGKTSILKLLPTCLTLNIERNVEHWSEQIKQRYTIIRKEGRYVLVHSEKDIKCIVIDDMELAEEEHKEYLRVLNEKRTIRDGNFKEYKVEDYPNVVLAWRGRMKVDAGRMRMMDDRRGKDGKLAGMDMVGKFDDRVVCLSLSEMSKDSLESIFRTNLENCLKQYTAPKEVHETVHNQLIKLLLILEDDLTAVYGVGGSVGTIMGMLKNMVGEAGWRVGKEGIIEVTKGYVWNRVYDWLERVGGECVRRRVKGIVDNVIKVLFGVGQKSEERDEGVKEADDELEKVDNGGELSAEESVLMVIGKLYNILPMSTAKQTLKDISPSVIIFDQLVKNVAYLSSQYNSIDKDVIVVGGKGTGKKYLVGLSAKLAKLRIVGGVVEALEAVLRKERVVMVHMLEKGVLTVAERVWRCENDAEVEMLLGVEERVGLRKLIAKNRNCVNCEGSGNTVNRENIENGENGENGEYREHTSSKTNPNLLPNPNPNSNFLLPLFHLYVLNTFISDTPTLYNEFCHRNHSALNYPLITVQPWPTLAMSTLHPTPDNSPELHSTIFSITNHTAHIHNLPQYSMQYYENYLQLYGQLYIKRKSNIEQQLSNLKIAHYKFNEGCELVEHWQNRVKILEEELKERIIELNNVINKNKLESFTLEILSEETKREEETVKQQQLELEILKESMKKHINLLYRVLEKIEKLVCEFQRGELSELRKIHTGSRLARFGLECLSILLDGVDEPNDKDINRLLADPNLLMRMKSEEVLNKKNNRLEEKYKKEIIELKNKKEEKRYMSMNVYVMNEKMNNTVKSLMEWFGHVIEYWETNAEHIMESERLVVLEEQYDKIVKHHNELLEQMRMINKKIIERNIMIGESEHKKNEDEKELMMLSNKLENGNKIVPILLQGKGETEGEINILEREMDLLKGNCILTAFCGIFLPLKRISIRERMLEEVKRVLRKYLVKYCEGFGRVSGESEWEGVNKVLLECEWEGIKLVVDPERSVEKWLEERGMVEILGRFVEWKGGMKNGKIEVENVDVKNQDEEDEKDKQSTTKQKEVSELGKLSEPTPSQPLTTNMLSAPLEKIQLSHQETTEITNKSNSLPHSIYYTTEQPSSSLPETSLIIDCTQPSFSQKDKIFLHLAHHNKPEYFQSQKQLTKLIENNLNELTNGKLLLYSKIPIDILQLLTDGKFIVLGEELLKLQLETMTLTMEFDRYRMRIDELVGELNVETEFVYRIWLCLKKVREIALDVLLDVVCDNGNPIGNALRFAMANVGKGELFGFLVTIVCFKEIDGENNVGVINKNRNINENGNDNENKNENIDRGELWKLLENVVNGDMLRQNDNARPKRPTLIAEKNWEILWKIAGYTEGLRRMVDHVMKSGKEFEIWVNGNMVLSDWMNGLGLKFVEKLFVISQFKQKSVYRAIEMLLKEEFGKMGVFEELGEWQKGDLSRLAFTLEELIVRSNPKFPLLINCPMHNIISLCTKLNNSKLKLLRVSSLSSELSLRSILSQSIENNEWFILHSLIDTKSITMAENICYYVVNYTGTLSDGFRLFVVDGKGSRKGRNKEGGGGWREGYIGQVGIDLLEREESFERLYEEYKLEGGLIGKDSRIVVDNAKKEQPVAIDQNITQEQPPTAITTIKSANGVIFSRLLKQLLLAHCAILIKYPYLNEANLPAKLHQLLLYLQHNNMPIEANLADIVQYIAKLYNNVALSSHHKDIEDMWDHIVYEKKLKEKVVFGVNMNDKCKDDRVSRNWELLGCQESYFVRGEMKALEVCYEIIDRIVFEMDFEKFLLYVRSALGRLAGNIVNREMSNQIYKIWLKKELEEYNEEIDAWRKLSEWINTTTWQGSEDYIDHIELNWVNLKSSIQTILNTSISKNRLKRVLECRMIQLRRRHDFLLYFNPLTNSFMINPSLSTHFNLLIASARMISFLQGQIKDVHQYVVILEFTHFVDEKDIQRTEGIVMIGLRCKEFRYVQESKTIEGIVEIDGEINAPMIVMRMKKVKNEEEAGQLVEIMKEGERTVGYVGNYAVFGEWNMRQACLIVE